MSNLTSADALRKYRDRPRDVHDQDSDEQTSDAENGGSTDENGEVIGRDAKYQQGHPLADDSTLRVPTAPVSTRRAPPASGSQPPQKGPGGSKTRPDELLSDLLQHQHRFTANNKSAGPSNSQPSFLRSAPVGQVVTANPTVSPQIMHPLPFPKTSTHTINLHSAPVGQVLSSDRNVSMHARGDGANTTTLGGAQSAPVHQQFTANPSPLPPLSLPPSFRNPFPASNFNLASAAVGQVLSTEGKTEMSDISDAEPGDLQSAPAGHHLTANPRPLPQVPLPSSLGLPTLAPGPSLQSASVGSEFSTNGNARTLTTGTHPQDLHAASIGQSVTIEPSPLPQVSLPSSFGNPSPASNLNLASAAVGQVLSTEGKTEMSDISDAEPGDLQSAPAGHHLTANPRPLPQVPLPSSLGLPTLAPGPNLQSASVGSEFSTNGNTRTTVSGGQPSSLRAAANGQRISANPSRKPLPTMPRPSSAPRHTTLANTPMGQILTISVDSTTAGSTDLHTIPPGQYIRVQHTDSGQLFIPPSLLSNPKQKHLASLRNVSLGGRVVRRCDDMQVDGNTSSSDGSEGDDESANATPGGKAKKVALRTALRSVSTYRLGLETAGKNHAELAAAVKVLTTALEQSKASGSTSGNPGAGGGRRRRKQKINDHPVTRSKISKKMSNYVRAGVAELLKMPGKKPRVPDGPPNNVSYPTARDFYFEWAEKMSSPWNVRSLSIVYKYVMEKHDDEADLFIDELGVDKIEKKIKKHAEYLKWLWMKQHHFTERDLELYNLAHSNYTRRRALFLRRLATCERHPTFRKHVKLYKSLGAAGTSSDEEGLTDSEDPGPQGHSKVFFVKQLPYLSTALTELNEEVDAQSEIFARKTFMRGSLPRRRIRTGLVSESHRTVFYLAENVYDGQWLLDLDEYERDRVQPDPEPHPF